MPLSDRPNPLGITGDSKPTRTTYRESTVVRLVLSRQWVAPVLCYIPPASHDHFVRSLAPIVAFNRAEPRNADGKRGAFLRRRGDLHRAPFGDDNLAHDVQNQPDAGEILTLDASRIAILWTAQV